MKKVSRRSFVAGMGAMPFALWLQKERIPIHPLRRTWVRYEARTTEGQKMLKIYADAANKMMNSTTAGDPRSWIFQWYTHAVRPDRTKSGEISSIYGSGSSANKTLATDAWSTCQPHFSGDEPAFLPWHRMYVYFFESIIRKVSGNDDFSLPYWNYSVGGAAHGVIPPEFTNSSDPTLKWLYRSNRNSGVNTGTAIDASDPGALSLDVMKQTSYEPNGAASGFNMDLDGGIHGNVHVDTGDPTNMGSVPWAARDPIFWMHHCNLDRLWASWNKNGGVNPGGSWLTESFTFADFNGTKVVATVSNFDSLAKLDYTYDRYEPSPWIRLPLPWPILQVAHPTPLQIHELAEIPLTAQNTRLAMSTARLPQPPKEAFTAHVAKLAPDKRIYLVIKNLRADAHPGVTYQVFLDLPAGRSVNEASAHRVGTINFFGAVTHHETAPGQPDPKFFSFDITDVVKGLQSNKLLQDKPVITIVPSGKPAADAKPVVGEVSIQEQ